MPVREPVTTDRPLRFHREPVVSVEVWPVVVQLDPLILLTVELTPGDYATVESAGLFHLTPAARGPGNAGFAPTDTVRIELRADDSVRDALREAGEDAAAVLDRLLQASADAGSPLLAADRWYALSVTTEVDTPEEFEGTLREGFLTVWSSGAGLDLSAPLTTVARVLAKSGIGVRPLDGAPGIEWTTHGTTGSWRSVALATDDGRVAVYGILPTRVDESRYRDVALVVAHLNSGMIIGNWELTVDTGEICMKTSVDTGDEPLGPALASRLIARNARAVDEGFELLERLAQGSIDTDDAVAAVAGTITIAGEP